MKIVLATALLFASGPAVAEVVTASSNGFQLRQTVRVAVTPEAAFKAFASIGDWWSPAHSYSGDATNLSLKTEAGGCFCERLPSGGGVEHMRVVYVAPGERIVMTGSLGPLLYEGTSGVMDVQIKPDAAGSQLILDYKVAGFANGGADKLAPLVDKVLGEQLARFASAAQRPGR